MGSIKSHLQFVSWVSKSSLKLKLSVNGCLLWLVFSVGDRNWSDVLYLESTKISWKNGWITKATRDPAIVKWNHKITKRFQSSAVGFKCFEIRVCSGRHWVIWEIRRLRPLRATVDMGTTKSEHWGQETSERKLWDWGWN